MGSNGQGIYMVGVAVEGVLLLHYDVPHAGWIWIGSIVIPALAGWIKGLWQEHTEAAHRGH